MIKDSVNRYLNKYSYYHVDDFTRPYIIEKNIEGVDFLFHIKDRDSRLWYDLYATDPSWPEMKFIRDNLIKPNDVVLECGSHHGCTAIMLSHWVGPNGRIYAYEPGLKNFEILRSNLSLNDIDNVSAVRAVVGGFDGVVDFIEDAASSMGAHVATGNENPGTGGSKIDQVSLDRHANDRPSLVKMDTQGYLYQPLLGLQGIIRNQRPNLALEIDGKGAIENYGDNFNEIFDLIAHEDYTYFVSFDEKEEPMEIKLSELMPAWEKRNNFTQDIHLFARNKNDA